MGTLFPFGTEPRLPRGTYFRGAASFTVSKQEKSCSGQRQGSRPARPLASPAVLGGAAPAPDGRRAQDAAVTSGGVLGCPPALMICPAPPRPPPQVPGRAGKVTGTTPSLLREV